MIYQPPSGARDLLPLDVAQKHWIEDRLDQRIQRWGYHRIITSTIENIETLIAGGAIDQSALIELQQLGGQRLGLRPELTASIARTAVTRLARLTYPQRLYYTANVFRHTPQSIQGGQQESYQAGVELLGAAGVMADAEILLLFADCLHTLAIKDWYLILGDAGLTRSLLEPFPDHLRDRVREAMAHLDPVALKALPLEEKLKQRALQMLNLRGRPEDVLQTVTTLNLTPSEQTTVNNLKSLVSLLRDTTQGSDTTTPPLPNLILDLSLIQTFDYYTGLVFEGVYRSDQTCRVLGRGGRYDNLLGVFHPDGKTAPGIGFVLSIEDLHQTLLPTGNLPTLTPASDWLVVSFTDQGMAAAFDYAQTIRASEALVRVEVQLHQNESQEHVRDMARRRNISRIAWINDQGVPEIESLV